jgi:hypothetical protein
MNNIVNLSPWAARAAEVPTDPALARFLAPVERRKLFDAAGNEAAHVGLYDDTKCVGVVSRRPITFCKTPPRMMS